MPKISYDPEGWITNQKLVKEFTEKCESVLDYSDLRDDEIEFVKSVLENVISKKCFSLLQQSKVIWIENRIEEDAEGKFYANFPWDDGDS